MELEEWDEDTVEVACTIARRTEVHDFGTMRVAKAISESRPELAPLLIAARLQREYDEAAAKCPTPVEPLAPDASEAEETVWARLHRRRRPRGQVP